MKTNKTSDTSPEGSIQLSAKKTAVFLLAFTVFLVAMDALRLLVKYKMPEFTRLGGFLEMMFQITSEYNVPTFFSSFVLVLAGVWLIFISRIAQQFRINWLLLGFVFIFLALDESLLIHESVSRLTRENVTVEGNLSYGTWVIPYLILTAALGAFYWKFVFQLPKRTMWLFIISGGIYVGGAAGFELVEGFLYTNDGETAFYKLVHWSQEVVEIFGIILFNYALIDYLSAQQITLTFRKG
jgi:hypothetical protein